MKNIRKLDENYNAGFTRPDIVAGYLEPDIAVETWTRLMPTGDAATFTGTDANEVDLGVLVDDIVSVEGWELVILTPGAIQARRITAQSEVDSTTRVVLEKGVRGIDKARSFQWTLRPGMVFPFVVNYASGATDALTLGATTQDASDPTRIKKIAQLSPGENFVIPTATVERLFIRFEELTTDAENHISWGEHYVS